MIAYFTLLMGEHCTHLIINGSLEHKHHNVLMISKLLIVNALYPNVALGFPHFSLSKIQDFFEFFSPEFPSYIFMELDGKYLNSNAAKVFL